MRRTSALAFVGLGVVPLAGCGQASPQSAPVAEASTAAADWCGDPAVAARTDEALASTTEGVHNGLLVTPEEMRADGHTDAEIAGQVAAWEALSDQDVAFQQCLRARQGQPPIDPVPGDR